MIVLLHFHFRYHVLFHDIRKPDLIHTLKTHVSKEQKELSNEREIRDCHLLGPHWGMDASLPNAENYCLSRWARQTLGTAASKICGDSLVPLTPESSDSLSAPGVQYRAVSGRGHGSTDGTLCLVTLQSASFYV